MEPLQPVTKQPNFVIYLLSGLLIISCLIAGFFAWKTQNLVEELQTLRKRSQSATMNQIPGSIEDWNVYNNELNGYSIKYPPTWKVLPSPDSLSRISSFSNDINKFEIGKHESKIEEDQSLKSYFLGQLLDPSEIIDESEIKFNEITSLRLVLPLIHGESNWKYGIYYTFLNNSDVYFLEYYTNDYNSDIKLSDQILSTFKFTSSSSVACPEDAKICPDGSSVVRIGPKCEFADCPTFP